MLYLIYDLKLDCKICKVWEDIGKVIHCFHVPSPYNIIELPYIARITFAVILEVTFQQVYCFIVSLELYVFYDIKHCNIIK